MHQFIKRQLSVFTLFFIGSFLFGGSVSASLWVGDTEYADGSIFTCAEWGGSCISGTECSAGKEKQPTAGCPNKGQICCSDSCVAAGGTCQAKKDCTEDSGAQVMQECTDQQPDGATGDDAFVCCIPVTAPQGEGAGGSGEQPTEDVVSIEGLTCTEPRTGVSFPCPMGPGTQGNIIAAVGAIIKFSLGIAGALFLGIFVYGGVLFIIAGDSSEKAGKAQKALANAVIGIFIIGFSYVILDWIVGIFGG